MYLSKKNLKGCLGIDINDDALDIAVISNERNTYTLQSYLHTSLPTGVVIRKEIKNLEAIVDIIKQTYVTLDTPFKNIAIALNDAAVIKKTILVDKDLSEDEIEEQLIYEMGKLINLSISEEINLDFQIIGPASTNINKLEVVVYATKKETIKPYIKLFDLAKLNLAIIDVESYVYFNLYERYISHFFANQIPQTIAVMDIRKTHIKTFVFHQRRISYCHEEFYYESNKSNNWQRSATQFVHLNLQMYHASNSNEVQQILITGDAAYQDNLDAIIQKDLGIPSQMIKPLSLINKNEQLNLSKLHADSSRLFLCCGLGIRGCG